ncbi:hypothetical protein [Marinifilum flexuosum]|uniref:Lipoprotein n=1 Tax=Marinifilum flexuosum TaxID=1117708 RepID=A0A419X431_9BACT|nr:hypothetical protein [Marinifilum flexuosum]RKE02475.1 hypothetical protein BXY64_2565 [Marinifilum flexuosum]
MKSYKWMYCSVIVLLVACKNNKLKRDQVQSSQISLLSHSDLDSMIIEYEKHANINIRIANNLYTTINEQPSWNADQYRTYCIDPIMYLNIIDSIFYFDDDLNSKKGKIQMNAEQYIKHVRNSVKQEFEEYGYAGGQDYGFLFDIKDHYLKELILQYVNNEALSAEQKDKLKKDLNLIESIEQ